METQEFIPRIIHFDITGRCNLNCVHCRGTIKKKELSTQEIKYILKNISKYWEKDIRWFEVGGGEPFIREDLFEILETIRKCFPKTQILLVSNGILIRKEWIPKIKSLIDRIQISLEGSNERIHSLMRGPNSQFKKVIEVIKMLVKNGIHTAIRTTVTKLNLHDVENIVRLAKDLNVKEVGIRAMVISSGNSLINKHLGISKSEYINLIETLPNLKKKYNIWIYSGDPIQNIVNPAFWKYLSNKEKNKDKLLEVYSGCIVGIAYIYINNEGKYSFCPMLNTVCLGDLLKEDIYQIWSKNIILSQLRKREYTNSKICISCQFRNVCGGCRARALLETGSLFGDDPLCHKYLRDIADSIVKEVRKDG